MLDPTKAFSSFAVRDAEEAARFYGQTLGMKVAVEEGMLFLRPTDDRIILAYPKPDHAPATFTILNFPVEDIDEAVEELAGKGVSFERYDGFDQDERGDRPGRDGSGHRLVHRPLRQHRGGTGRGIGKPTTALLL